MGVHGRTRLGAGIHHMARRAFAGIPVAFQPAGSGDFPVASFETGDKNVPRTCRQECLRHVGPNGPFCPSECALSAFRFSDTYKEEKASSQSPLMNMPR